MAMGSLSAGKIGVLACIAQLAAGIPAPPPRTDRSRIAKVTVDAREHGQCGATHLESKEWYGEKPKCGEMLSTNCSVTYSPMQCPESCPFIAPNHAFACLFSCVAAENCADGNPGRPFPDRHSMTCMPCGILGCKQCSGPNMCKECHNSFSLKDDGKTCEFYMDSMHIFDSIAWTVKYLLLFLIILGLFWGCVMGPNPDWEVNAYSIFRARRHRHMVKTMKWEMNNKREATSFYSIFFNVHKKNFVGVGIALFYNSVIFTAGISFLLFAVTSMVYQTSGVRKALSNFDSDPTGLYYHGLSPNAGAPVVVISRLYVCAGSAMTDLQNTLQDFAGDNFRALCALYVMFFGLLLGYARKQKIRAAVFNSQNATMADYAIRISGLPKDLTDEAEVREWVETEFRKACPGKFQRPPKVEDMGKVKGDVSTPRPDSEIEVFGVSLCYDYLSRWSEVDDLIQTMNMRIEVEAAAEANANPAVKHKRNLTTAHIGGQDIVEKEKTMHRDKVVSYFEGADKIQTNGEAFVVFTWSEDVTKLWEAWENRKSNMLGTLRHPKNPNEYITFNFVRCEPPSVNWQYLGKPLSLMKVAKGLAWILFLIVAVVTCAITPYYQYILKPYSSLGSAASGTKTMIMGIIIGNLNMLISIQIWMTSFNMGFHRREKMDSCVLFCNVVQNMVNIGFTVIVSCLQAYHLEPNPDPLNDFLSIAQMRSIGVENSIAEAIFNMMMPGFFFVGNFMTLIMAGLWPYIFNNFLMKLIYTWAALPKPLLKIIRVILPWAPDELDKYPFWRAEKALEPMEIQIGDYANLIIIPTICASMLFILSPYTNKLFKWMFVWALVYYMFLRFLHLRFCKKCYYTTNIIDNFVNFLWGLPLSVVAAAACQWGFRSGLLGSGMSNLAKLACVIACFFGSYGLWLGTYWLVIKPWKDMRYPEEETLDVLEVKDTTFYSWFNCNPVFVLKCEYYWQDVPEMVSKRRKGHPIACGEDQTKVRFYSVGKEYLFLKSDRQHLAFPDYRNQGWPGDIAEFETYLELMMRFMSNTVEKLKGRSNVEYATLPQDSKGAALLSQLETHVEHEQQRELIAANSANP